MEAISPHVERLAMGHKNKCVFLKVDVDHASDIASSCGIRAMPTFHFYLRGRLVDEFSGADLARLESNIAKLAPASLAFSGQGQRLGGVDSVPSSTITLNKQEKSPLVNRGMETPSASTSNNAGIRMTGSSGSSGPSGSTTIQLRLPDNTKEEGFFAPTDTLKDVASFLIQRRPELMSFSFLQMYPKRLYKPAEFEKVDLVSSGLHPRGALQVVI
mmetsp:Transcript_12615/g.25604  ORF Transcript_12615/g.25604 Transcript_12615/m.25604 type:complete len:215 (-) Transcript_12615:1526-2170(-)